MRTLCHSQLSPSVSLDEAYSFYIHTHAYLNSYTILTVELLLLVYIGDSEL